MAVDSLLLTVPMKLSSNAFSNAEIMPRRFARDGQNLSPPFEWNAVPARARSLAIICDDSDAPGGTWHHGTVYDIAPIDQFSPRRRPRMAARSPLNKGSTTSENKATVVRAHPIGMGLIIIIFVFWRSRLDICRSGTTLVYGYRTSGPQAYSRRSEPCRIVRTMTEHEC